jgi:uncharacterized protein
MRWKSQGPSEDIEDRRAETAGRGIRPGHVGIGLGGLLLLGALSLLFGENFFTLLDFAPTAGPSATRPYENPGATSSSPAEEREIQFVSFVLDDVQATWNRVLPATGTQYQNAKLVLFRDAIQSTCGFADAASGPFYCPADHKIYIDLGFYDDLRKRFGAPGDFAQAYVIAHELGHHVQNLLGIDEQVRRAQESRPRQANQLSVQLELQADCLAGVWGHSTAQRNLLEQGDVEEGLNAASAIGDDRIQRMSTGRVFPERFTHGSSAQRVEWFRRGLSSGQIRDCNTFAGVGG